MDLLTYSSNEDSALNNARRQYWSDCYMLGQSNINPDKYEPKSFWMCSINQSRNNLKVVAKRYRSRLAQRNIYKVPMIGESGVAFTQNVLACSAANARYRANDLNGGLFTAGEPICMGAA